MDKRMQKMQRAVDRSRGVVESNTGNNPNRVPVPLKPAVFTLAVAAESGRPNRAVKAAL